MNYKDLNTHEYNPYYQTYIGKTNGLELKDGLKSNSQTVVSFLRALPESKHEYCYADDKWTVKEVLLHIIDTERIFAYRALRIARKDKTALPGFDQDEYVPHSNANARSFQSLIKEYETVRLSTTILFDSFTEEILLELGTASNSPISVRALGFIMIGHENHHCEIIRERYL
ncbi:MAG: DinB family protein [Aquaticitalea sp.]